MKQPSILQFSHAGLGYTIFSKTNWRIQEGKHSNQARGLRQAYISCRLQQGDECWPQKAAWCENWAVLAQVQRIQLHMLHIFVPRHLRIVSTSFNPPSLCFLALPIAVGAEGSVELGLEDFGRDGREGGDVLMEKALIYSEDEQFPCLFFYIRSTWHAQKCM